MTKQEFMERCEAIWSAMETGKYSGSSRNEFTLFLQDAQKDVRNFLVFTAWELAAKFRSGEPYHAEIEKFASVALDIEKGDGLRNEVQAELLCLDASKKADGVERAKASLARQAEMKAARLASEEAQKEAYRAKQEAAESRRERFRKERTADENAAELARLELLRSKDRKQAIINAALAAGDLTPVVETRDQRIANERRRSGGGIVRLESGDGK